MARWGRGRRAAPKSAPARVRFLLGSRGKDTKRVADQLGVSERTVRGWLSGIRKPSKANAAKLEAQTEAKYEAAARESAKAAHEPYVSGAAGGVGRMRLNGYVTMLGQTTSKYNRPRNIVQPVNADQAARAQAAYQTGDEAGLLQVAREVLAEYFNSGGGYNFAPDQLDFDLSAIEFE